MSPPIYLSVLFPITLTFFDMFTKQTLLAFVGALALAAAKTITEKNPTQAEIDAARATVLPYSPVSNVKGLAFDRFVDIWLENTVLEPLA